MQAVILAAGMGKRLGVFTKNNTKCMIKVNNTTLIERMLSQLDVYSLDRIIIVIGYEGDSLKNYISTLNISTPILYVNNPIYDKTNNIYSLHLAKNYLVEDDTLLLESDLIFDTSILKLVIDNPYPNIALVDKYETWMDGTMVRIDEHFNIVNFIPKKAFRYSDIDQYYKTVNIYKFSKNFTINSYLPFLEAYTKALGNNEYYEQVLRIITMLDNNELKALPLSGEKWYEIDDAADLDTAETIFATENSKLAKYQKRYGGYWRFPSLKDFCYLVNPFFPPLKMKEELISNFNILLAEYPSGQSVNNLLAAKNFGINPNYICVGNGAAELISSLMNSINEKIGVIYPTFEEYPNRISKEQIIPFYPNNKQFTYSVDDLISFYSKKNINYLLLINPDNPSGNFVSKEDIIKLLDWSKTLNVYLILDESFVDFSLLGSTNSLLNDKILEKYSNLIVVKSISKSYGVPGLRLGVIATSNKDILTNIKKDISIWNINSFAEFYMQIYSKYDSAYQNACILFKRERDFLKEELDKIGFLCVIPSQANYFLCEITDKYTSTQITEILLEKFDILIKDCKNKPGFDTSKHYIRIAIKGREDNITLINALKQM